MKVKVKFENKKYKVSFCDKFCIEFLKFRLFCKRQNGRIKIIFSKDSLLLYLLIRAFWMLFAFASYCFGQEAKGTIENPYTVTDVIWDLKNSYFTSVILAFAINSINRIREYKKKLRSQHYLYTDTMKDFENLFREYLIDELQFYHPLYCYKTLKYTENYILNKTKPLNVELAFLEAVEQISKRLESLEMECKRGNLIISDSRILLTNINLALKENNHLILYDKTNDKDSVVNVAKRLMFILDCLREPWRKNIDIKLNILKRLDRYKSNELYKNINYTMLLYGKPIELCYLLNDSKYNDEFATLEGRKKMSKKRKIVFSVVSIAIIAICIVLLFVKNKDLMIKAIDICNKNAGFISLLLSLITIGISVVAIIISIRVAKMPYLRELKFDTMMLDENGKPYMEIWIMNVGNSPIYLCEIALEQKIMKPLALGFIDDIPREERILAPYVPRTFRVEMQNYNPEEFDHENHPIKVNVETTTKTFTRQIGWARG